MALVDITEFRHLLVCPRCRRPLACEEPLRCTHADCRLSQRPFAVISGSRFSSIWRPASSPSTSCVRPTVPLRSSDRRPAPFGACTDGQSPEPPRRRTTSPPRRFSGCSTSCAADTSWAHPKVLVIGGGAMGHQIDELYEADDVHLVSFDIYASPLSQFIADAHGIPLASGSMDAVVIQAVLEHVLEPWNVVDEIHRILRDDGLVYSDTPFLQPVHEGPYDFTRFTDSGHRALFKRFTIIDSGLLRGSGTTLSWVFADSSVPSPGRRPLPSWHDSRRSGPPTSTGSSTLENRSTALPASSCLPGSPTRRRRRVSWSSTTRAISAPSPTARQGRWARRTPAPWRGDFPPGRSAT